VAALAGIVILAPLALALLGEDYYIPRALMPAWPPLAVLVAAASTAPRARVAGGALAIVTLSSFVFAQPKITCDARYQRSDRRGLFSQARRIRRCLFRARNLAVSPRRTDDPPPAQPLPGSRRGRAGGRRPGRAPRTPRP